ncbi:MAG TPA: hypothetical protein VFT75_12685 [Nocardioidaceae bacterium]|jgi:hypothetical protein|nr:hypothetical protein [Nocardioidaceae bacterium]
MFEVIDGLDGQGLADALDVNHRADLGRRAFELVMVAGRADVHNEDSVPWPPRRWRPTTCCGTGWICGTGIHTAAFTVDEHGDPAQPGQTRLDNLGGLERRLHRVKTHKKGWRVYQPTRGVYLWRSPHGHWYRVDHTGTHRLGKTPDLSQPDIDPDAA